jgi:FAD/FMN-containing dehydrogenase
MRQLTRRSLLNHIGTATIVAPALLLGRAARAALPPLPNLGANDALFLRPGDGQFDAYQRAFNARTEVTPQLRAVCRTAKAVGIMIDWCRSNNLAFALRSGGHCYEGLSQSDSVVIDTRRLDAITVDARARIVTVGAGASLGSIYTALARRGLVLPAGSCPPVGVSGHVLGGGYGYLARPFGLACDSLLSIDLVDPQGKQIRAEANQNSDLYWANRGGGGGSFGAVTGFRFKVYPLRNVLTFRIVWQSTPGEAAKVMRDWQAWAPNAPQSINALMLIKPAASGVELHCIGQSIGPSSQLRRELRALSNSRLVVSRSFLAAVNYFAGPGGWDYESRPMKGKSDYVIAPLSEDAFTTLMNELTRVKHITVVCDPYGGAISRVPADATAFAHRAGTLFGLQYVTQWDDPSHTESRLKDMHDAYAAMRPYMSGSAYVNYCDIDLDNWADAYWGQNLPRLKQIKAKFDPDNVFRHAQSVPLA